MSGKAAPRFRSPLHQAKGLGSAKSGTGHFWWQRVTAVILALLVPYIVFMLACLAGSDADTLRMAIAKPWNAIIFSVFAIALFWHAKLGLQVVIEDYVHDRNMHLVLRILLILGSLVGVLSAIYAIARIAMTA
ncbi:succinate dehydrogenase, hydrophobic membrane anchor protein [Lysobacteraceae bacterium NML71-0210]|nr:succinate dehydrogenase, hydrophobic membrane anchor protein [Xanthomonadaceae bacterium NML71-0210]PJK10991.1 succinate dehydrogenase, hydrophobic membrane anchor protein [Xanthomonadaceae bacterium NML08-0793]PJK14825.1 succinate dehydrogenase, hydrophobic membrane anchor protein [Xanthomonadaceae bacterium NML07-0707]